jgi:hypothetical protein
MKSSILAVWALGAVLCTALAVADDSKPASKPVKTALPDRMCPRDTGSRIPTAPNECSGVGVGHSYTREEMDRTGAVTIGGALRHLDTFSH